VTQTVPITCCPDCGAYLSAVDSELAARARRIETLGEQLEAQREAIASLQQDLTSASVRNKQLRSEQAGKWRSDPRSGDVQHVLAEWQKLCMPSATNPVSDKRATLCLARMKADKRTPEMLIDACRGYALKPFVVGNGRRAAQGRPDEWRADASLIFRDDDHVVQGINILAAYRQMMAATGGGGVVGPGDDPGPTERAGAQHTGPQLEQRENRAPSRAERIGMYTRLGWKLFPCRPRSKAPATRHGFQDATGELGRIVRYAEAHPDANWAIATGAMSSVVVLDVDDVKGGGESLHDLEQRYGPLPRTLSATTPRGGQHFYFRHPGRWLANAVGIVPGIDVRGDGGYVLIAPSYVKDEAEGIDGRYEWDERADVADMPEWLAKHLLGHQRQIRSPQHWLGLVKQIPAGKRNQSLTEFAGKMIGSGLDQELVATIVLAINARACKPPLDDREVSRILDSIWSRHYAKGA
jgi:hypothetical protein